jgi:hypothetical protein
MVFIIPKALSIIIIHNDNTSLVRAWEGNGGNKMRKTKKVNVMSTSAVLWKF